jgi:hypothetical protein
VVALAETIRLMAEIDAAIDDTAAGRLTAAPKAMNLFQGNLFSIAQGVNPGSLKGGLDQ